LVAVLSSGDASLKPVSGDDEKKERARFLKLKR
jgi:hypothetical protein